MGTITIVGLGYEEKQLTLEAAELLESGARVILHTERCGCADWLKRRSVAFETLDRLYEECDDFDLHAARAADAVIAASEEQDVVYGVFDVRDRSAGEILNRTRARVVAGPPAEGALLAHAQDSTHMLVAADWESFQLSAAEGVLIRELDSRELASEVKLKLMDCYPEEEIVFVHLADGGIARTELFNLDRLSHYDHRTSAYIPPEQDLMRLSRYDFSDLQAILARLCAPDGCPWDREQTHQSLRPYVVEEAYEIVDAIDADEPFHLADELGDMLLQVAFHAEIAKRYSEFDMSDVTTAICEKMLQRHSHIFGIDHASQAGEVASLWEKNKMRERGQTRYSETLREVSRSLPAMMRAAKVLKRLDGACGCAETADSARKNAIRALSGEAELGEALLACVSLARAMKIDPEIALNAATDRLIHQFEKCENGAPAEELSAATLKEYWHLVKLSDSAEK